MNSTFLETSRRLRVFISHASPDKPRLEPLLRWLRDAGTDPWLDIDALQAGADWDAAITQALRQSDLVIVCLSRLAIRRAGYFQKELRRAIDVADEQPEGSTFLIPARLEPCQLPASLARWQALDLWQDEAFRRLTDALRTRAAQLSDAAEPSAAIAPPALPSWAPQPSELIRQGRRSWAPWWAVASVAAFLAVAGFLWFQQLGSVSGRSVAEPPSPSVVKLAPKRIVIMDARHPDLIYDRRTREDGGTNADDIDEALSRLTDPELEPRIKELIFPNWVRDDEIRRMNPDLVIIHGSAFYNQTNTHDTEQRLRSFLRSMVPTKTRILIYSRGAIEENEVVRIVPGLKGRVRTLHVENSFRNPVTVRELNDLVRAILTSR